MRFWGITGTNGKTTTTWIAAEMMHAAYITTVEVWTGKRRFYSGYTTPPLSVLKEIYAEMEECGIKDCVMEVSSHAIHQNRVGFGDTTFFSGGAFTNLSEDHLDYHKTMAEYFRVKRSFAEAIGKMHESAGLGSKAPFVVCLDGENGEKMYESVKNIPGIDAIPVSVNNPGYDLSGLQLAGEYNKSNVLVAAAIAEAAGVPKAEIQAVIPTLTPRWGRLEKVETASKADVYVDFAHTPDGLAKVLSAVRHFANGRVWVVFGAGGDRDRMKRPLMGEACANGADELVVTSDNPRSEEPEAIIADILAGIPAEKHAAVIPERREAIYHALANAADGDVVVICGKGHETTQEIKGVKLPFDDRTVAREFRPQS
ncbi:MAG: UDP-N-acetylmuramoyl-L-alanyl-D-glutamate--2,6-diaminopimelate ligase [Kiritimatiellae bacterium]|nr:UDP-N-acetylmuramoyl-L-alanyl-D-glutamate--2,6-diaminopimelate ligase [Kiritimatiellia bacterium]